jgi:hypothetical protein
MVRDLTQRLRRRGAKLEPDVQLFPGLLPFTEALAPVFFGRDREIVELEGKLKTTWLVANSLQSEFGCALMSPWPTSLHI